MIQLDSKAILYMLTGVFNLNWDSTEERLKLQKTIYLLQIYGLKLDYGFSWYKYGPHSRDLVTEAYQVLRTEKAKYKHETKSWKFSENSLLRFERFKQICTDVLNDPIKLELVASVDFAHKIFFPKEEEKEFIEEFKRKKHKLFNDARIDDSMIKKALDISNNLRKENKGRPARCRDAKAGRRAGQG